MEGGEESVVGSASIYSFRFRLGGIGVFSQGIESISMDDGGYGNADSARLRSNFGCGVDSQSTEFWKTLNI